MKILVGIFSVYCLLCVSAGRATESAESYIDKAKSFAEAEDFEGAIGIMREAVEEYPEHSSVHAFLGLYLGQSAGETKDVRVQAARAFESFEVLDDAVRLDSLGVHARLYRGLMGVKVPEFLGKRAQGIEDLGIVTKMHRENRGEVSDEMAVSAYRFLAEVYEEEGRNEAAIEAWREVVRLAPDPKAVQLASEKIKELSPSEVEIEEGEGQPSGVPRKPKDLEEMAAVAKALIKGGEYEEAEEVLKRAIALDSSRAELYLLRAMAVAMRSSRGYDEAIVEGKNLRVNMCFETMEYLDKAVELAPEDAEARLFRGTMGVNFPFFVGRLDEAISDLEQVLKSSAHDTLKAEALYQLGLAQKKKAVTHWVKIVTDYPESPAAGWVFDAMRPQIDRIDLSKYDGDVVVVDLELGFQEELPPQTALWVEDGRGSFVKTLYVSGYAGRVGSEEVTLPAWGGASDFEMDATTGASVDVGHHAYVWDLTDGSGKRAADGEYLVRAEVSYWPSMQYQVVSARIEVGGGEKTVEVEEGNLIPYLGVRYLPRRGE